MSALPPSAREIEGVINIIVSPLVAVLSMVIGCSMLKDSNPNDYQPLYLAARMGAVGGPISAFACALVSFAITPEDEDEFIDPTDHPKTFILEQMIHRIRIFWGFVTPYMIGIGAGPVGSGILRAAHLAHSIPPIAALRAASVGGIFATVIYYILALLFYYILNFFYRDTELEEAVIEKGELDMHRFPQSSKSSSHPVTA